MLQAIFSGRCTGIDQRVACCRNALNASSSMSEGVRILTCGTYWPLPSRRPPGSFNAATYKAKLDVVRRRVHIRDRHFALHPAAVTPLHRLPESGLHTLHEAAQRADDRAVEFLGMPTWKRAGISYSSTSQSTPLSFVFIYAKAGSAAEEIITLPGSPTARCHMSAP